MLEIYLNKLRQFLVYDIYFFPSLFFLILITAIYFLKTEEKVRSKIYLILFLISVFVFVIWSSFLSISQYLIWLKNPISKYLLPPYQKIDYFLNYAYFHFWRDFIYRLISVLLAFLFLKFLNFIFKRDIFYDDEKIFIPFLMLFFFFPYNLFIIFLGFFMLLLIIVVLSIKQKEKSYFSFRNYWLFLVWILFLIQPFFLTNYVFLQYKP